MLRKLWLPLGWLWVGVVFYLSLMPVPPQPLTFDFSDKLEHALAYAWLMLWFCQGYAGQARIKVMLWLLAMGVGIEILQGVSGYRYFELADMLANATGVLVGWGLAQTAMGRILGMSENDGK